MTFQLPNVSCAVAMSRHFGRLIVSDGEVAFLPAGKANALTVEPAHPIKHRDDDLTVIIGRLRPPG